MVRSKEPTLAELFDLAVTELDSSIRKPNILAYGSKPYPEQERFHKTAKRGRFLSGGNRGGKCIVEGTLIQMANGTTKKIEDVEIGEYVIAPDGTATQVVDVWDKGLQPVNRYRIGRYQDIEEVVVTENHRFWSARETHGTLNEFQRHPVKELVNQKGRHKIMRSQGTQLGGIREERAMLLGLMLGDGCMGDGRPSNFQFTCADPELIADLPGMFIQRKNPIQYALSEAKAFGQWVEELGLAGTRSHTKFIPSEVWGWDEQSIAEVIGGLAVTDGSWWVSTKGEHHFSYSSISKELAEGFRQLAGIRLGIWGSTVVLDKRGNYCLTYGTKEALAKLAQLPLPGCKKRLAEAAIPIRDSYSSHVSVKSFTEEGYQQCYDLSVAHESHCFMLANGIFTSNTDAEVVEAIWWATNTHPYIPRPESWGKGAIQIRFVVVDIAKGVEQIILPKLKRWMTSSMLIDGSWDKSWDAKNLILTLSNGSSIDFVTWGMDMMKLGGVPRHLIFFDEEPPQHIFNESMMRLIDYNGWWVIAATPTKGMGWTFDLLWEPALANPDGDVATFQLSAEQNPYIEADMDDMNFYMMGMDKEEREVREKGTFVARSGLVFPQFAAETSKFVVPQYLPPKEWEWYMSIDHGWNNPTAILWHAVAPNGEIVTFAESYKSQTTVAEHAALIHEREAAWGKEPDMRTGDPALKQTSGITGTSVLQAYAEENVNIAVDGVPRTVMVGIEKMQSYMRIRPNGTPTWTVTENCVNLIRELKKLRWATYSSDKQAYAMNKQEEIHKKDDHASDSLRYFMTLMPDLRPNNGRELTPQEKTPTTISYMDLLAKMASDPNVHMVNEYDETDSSPQWETFESMGEYFDGSY